MKKLYLFDFDGTLTYKDTMFMYLKFYNPARFNFQFAKHIPLFILLKLKLANAERVKKSFVSSILKGQSKAKIEAKSKEFFEKYYEQKLEIRTQPGFFPFTEPSLEFMIEKPKSLGGKKGDYLIITAGYPIGQRGMTNLIHTVQI